MSFSYGPFFDFRPRVSAVPVAFTLSRVASFAGARPSMSAPRFRSFADVLRERTDHAPDALAFKFHADGEAETDRLTYGELARRVRAIARKLVDENAVGKPVLLLFPPGLDYIAAFLGCLEAGSIAVPLYPPEPTRLDRTVPRLLAVVRDAGAQLALTTCDIAGLLEGWRSRVPTLGEIRSVVTDRDLDLNGDWTSAQRRPEDLAFLQYTSGSTGTPKGVMVTHSNLLHHSKILQQVYRLGRDTRMVSWLPLYHDMGLIGGILQPLFTGFPALLMPPAAFLRKPSRWLRAISDFRGTLGIAPNFGYDLCVTHVTDDERGTLDLASWQVAITGAEPVRAGTLRQFAKAFAWSGFRPEAFYPSYGLAEATLMVCAGRAGKGGTALAPPRIVRFDADELTHGRARTSPHDGASGAPVASIQARAAARELVGHGRPAEGELLRIVEPETGIECSPGAVGEVWLQGPSVAGGYWRRAEETRATFAGRMSDGTEPWLRTGDLGFLHEGEFFVAGRRKDLIILRGRNYYPQDLEQAAEGSDPLLRPGCAVALSVEGDRVVVVLEARTEDSPTRYAAALQASRSAIAEQCELQVSELLLVGRNEVPKTSSGKIQRARCAELLAAGSLTVLARDGIGSAAASLEPVRSLALEARALAVDSMHAIRAFPEPARSAALDVALRIRVSASLDRDLAGASADATLVALGLDSLTAVDLHNRLRRELDLDVPPVELLDRMRLGELLERLRQIRSDRVDSHAGEQPQPREHDRLDGPLPLSAGQQALWYLNRLNPESPAYNQIFAARVTSALDVDALQTALDTILDRHAVLRTTYHQRDGEPFQQTQDAAVKIARIDASAWNAAEIDARLAWEVSRPFDLENGPLLRAMVLATASAPLLLLVVHHIAADFWSLGVIIDELGRAYHKAHEGGTPDLGPRPAEYGRYVQELAAKHAGPRGDRDWEYWRKQLESSPRVALDLPIARSRSPVAGTAGASHAFTLSRELAKAVRRFASERGTTLYTVLLSAFEAVVHRYAGATDFVIGSPVAGRDDARFAESIGYFVNMVPLRADLSGRPSFAEFVERNRRKVLEAIDHQAFPFARIVDGLGLIRDPSRSTPLFDAVFLLQKPGAQSAGSGLVPFALGEPGGRLSLGEVQLESIAVTQNLARFDLELWMFEDGDGLRGSIRYRTDLFDPPAITRWMQHMVTLLDAAMAAPDRPIAALPILTASEHARAVRTWNDTTAPYDREVCLHELFEASAARSPDAIAVAFEERSITYRALDERANQIAHHLVARGVRRGDSVVVLLDRGAQMIPALLGTLKAGAQYVPVEPSFPILRIAEIVSACRARHALTEPRHAGAFSDRERFPTVEHVVSLDADGDAPSAISSEPRTKLPRRSGADDVAYTLFTSGSTGTPKGVSVQHRPVTNLIEWVNRQYAIGVDDRVLFVTSLCFDLSVYDVFGLLAAGGSIRVASIDDTRDPRRLLAWLDSGEITFWDSAPAALQLLVPFLGERHDVSGIGERASRLRLVFLSGDWIPVTLPGVIVERFAAASVIALGGATEATVWSNFFPIDQVDTRWASIPYGRPIQNARYYVLDVDLNPCPVGVPGALYIGGDCLALGYAGDPTGTADSFGPDPYADRPGARMYRTGDRAAWWEDGTIEFLGRLHGMVKVRGYRIEPTEVETALVRHPRVREAAVIVRPARDGGNQLVAYVAPNEPLPSAAPADVTHWRRVFDEVYGGAAADDPAFDVSGWVDSYLGTPFPPEEMREWVDTTVERIMALTPRRVLEIGCGTGLLLARIAPSCDRYVGVDVSARALAHVRERLLPSRPELQTRVVLHELSPDWADSDLQRTGSDGSSQATHLSTAVGQERFDLVIINSVCQYFPDAEYLRRVIERVAATLADDGKIFVGDVRNLALLDEFHTSVALARAVAEDDLEVATLGRRARSTAAAERELLLHPRIFVELASRIPPLRSASVLIKAGNALNEMTQFRFDVVLSTADDPNEACAEWSGVTASLADLASRVAEERPKRVRIVDLVDARLTRAVATHRLLAQHDGKEETARCTVGELRAASRTLARQQAENGSPPSVHPAAGWAFASLLPGGPAAWHVEVCWPRSGKSGRFDLVVTDRTAAPDDHAQSHARALVNTSQEGTRDPRSEHARVEARTALSSRALANQPVRRTPPATSDVLISELREHLRERLPAYMIPTVFVVVSPGLPTTANGKLDRAALPIPEEAPVPVAAGESAPRNEVEAALAKVWTDVLGRGEVGIHDRFFDLGGDSILSIEVVARAAKVGIHLTPRDMFKHQTIAELATVAVTGSTKPSEPSGTPPPGGSRVDKLAAEAPSSECEASIPLTPIQRWFFSLGLAQPAHFNQSLLFAVEGEPLNPRTLEHAIRAVFAQHEAFRLRFRRSAGERWTQELAPEAAVEVRRVYLPEPDPGADLARPAHAQGTTTAPDRIAEQRRKCIAQTAAEQNASLDLTDGPTAGAALFCGAPGCELLLLTVHHLVIDAVSWRILLDDLHGAYRRASAGETFVPPPRTATLSEVATALRRPGRVRALRSQLAAWQRVHSEARAPNGETRPAPPAQSLPRRGPIGDNGLEADGDVVRRTLTREETEDLTRATTARRVRIDDLLLTALATALKQSMGVARVRVDLEGHGRDVELAGLNVVRTIGWFTTMTPLLLDLTEVDTVSSTGVERALLAVNKQIRATPGTPGDFDALRHPPQGPSPAELAAVAVADVSFNYLGRLDGMGSGSFRVVPGAGGPMRAASNHRPYLLEVNAYVLEGTFAIEWSFSTKAHEREQIEALAEAYGAVLRMLSRHGEPVSVAELTESDFPMADLRAGQLGAVLGQLRRAQQTAPRATATDAAHDITSVASTRRLDHASPDRAPPMTTVSIDDDAKRNAWIRSATPDSGAPRVVCLPYSGVGASIYREWSALLSPVAHVCAVQLPGREERVAEPPVRHIDALLAQLVPALRPWLDRPFVVFGHCLGGLLAAELAVVLAREGLEPRALFLSGTTPPWLAEQHPADLSQVTDVDLVREMRRRGTLPTRLAAEPSLMALTMPAVRADIALGASMQARRRPTNPLLTCPLVLFAGADDATAPIDAMQEWSRLTSGETTQQRVFPGNHFFFDTHGSDLAAEVAEFIGTLAGGASAAHDPDGVARVRGER